MEEFEKEPISIEKIESASSYNENSKADSEIIELGRGEYDLIHRDLEKVSDSEIIPQKRLFTYFYKKQLPDIPQNDDERKTIPLKSWNIFGTLFFTWCFSVMKVGYRRTIQPNDLMKLDSNHNVEAVYEEFNNNWQNALKKHNMKNEEDQKNKLPKYYITWVLFKTFKYRYSYAIFCIIIANLASAFTPLVSKHLISFVAEKQIDKSLKINAGAGYAIGCTCLLIFTTIFNAQGMYNSYIVGAQVRSILTKALLQKSFKLSAKGKHKFSASKITSLATTDMSRIEMGFVYQIMLWGFPGAMIVVIYLLIHNIGPVSLIGLGFFFVSLFVSLLGFKFVMEYRIIANKSTDARVSFVRDIINSLKIIKFYAWEEAFLKQISKKRKDEIHQVKKMQSILSLVIAYGVTVPTFAALLTFICLYQIKNGHHSAADVFSSLSLFQVVSSQMFIIPQGLNFTINGLIGLSRIQECLLAEEVDKETMKKTPCEDSENSIELENCSYEWEHFAEEVDEKEQKFEKASKNQSAESESDASSNEKTDEIKETKVYSNFKGLNNLTFNIKKGEFIVVTGSIGTGKSSLLLALTQLMKQTGGEYRQNGDLLLCGQPWVQNATIKDNITFGSDVNEAKYKKVLDICSLNDDLEILPAGDYTEIGERGINLSGGQKARINLARTVYKDSDIYLFDDVLSAVDARVGKHIMEKCILGELAEKTRVLATHQLNLIHDADRVIFLSSDGSVEIDTMDKLLASKPEFEALMANATASQSDSESTKEQKFYEEKPLKNESKSGASEFTTSSRKNPQSNADKKEAAALGHLIEKEERAVNSIEWKIYKNYLVSGLGSFWVIFLSIYLFMGVGNTFSSLFSSVWLSFWNEMKWKHKSKGFYMGLYALWTVLSFVFLFFLSLLTQHVCLTTSKRLHDSAIKNVLHAPMSFIDVTPLGRIINRFTKDMDVLDSDLPMGILMAVFCVFEIGGVVIMCIIYIPWFAISLPVFAFVFVVISDYYRGSAREVKRLEAVQRSFVYNNFNEVISGIDTIKIFSLSHAFLQKNDVLTDRQNEATILYIGLQRWSIVFINLIGSAFTIVLSFLCISSTISIGAASTGLLLNYSFEFCEVLTSLLTQTTQLENNMNSVERVVTYKTDLPQEKAYHIPEMKPEESWPQEANITFENVSLSYRPGLPLVLKDINLSIRGGEKIGICGRTGAGKSTIMSALYRIIELAQGRVIIDGVDISKIGLYDLRSKLSIIPQEPVLFKGTIKSNLDPFEESTDEDLWEALVQGGAIEADELETVKNQEIVQSSANKESHKFHLYQNVDTDGANFSLGERQLLTLARALVRKSKILILDEATSSVDYETDAKIQSKIAAGFADSTILCIAHRLKTIIHYDKILVLDKGEVREYDTPLNLFLQKDSIFREMCIGSGIFEEDF